MLVCRVEHLSRNLGAVGEYELSASFRNIFFGFDAKVRIGQTNLQREQLLIKRNQDVVQVKITPKR